MGEVCVIAKSFFLFLSDRYSSIDLGKTRFWGNEDLRDYVITCDFCPYCEVFLGRSKGDTVPRNQHNAQESEDEEDEAFAEKDLMSLLRFSWRCARAGEWCHRRYHHCCRVTEDRCWLNRCRRRRRF